MAKRILIIDDESNIRMMMRLALTSVGYEVEAAPDGMEGLERFGDGSTWDLVLLDQRMPGMAGLEVLSELRARRPDARAVMITAFGTIDLAAEAMRAGATDFLRKPFTVESLRDTVSAALDGHVADSPESDASPIPFTFDRANINGFRIESTPGVNAHPDGGIDDSFEIRSAGATISTTCRVVLPSYVVELVRAHADRETFPGGDSFYQALCGEALANYLWQNHEVPEENELRVDDLTSGLRHWIDAVLTTEKQ